MKIVESYTPGHGTNSFEFMHRRTFESHGQFFAGHLAEGLGVLDCGCGPGSITMGIARAVAPGRVVGVDFAHSQVEKARAAAGSAGVDNAEFVTGSCYELPLADCSFDRVFSHALMEHLAEPARAAVEFRRVLKPGGAVGLCSPDWSGFLVTPPSAELSAAIIAYERLQTRNGGDVRAGHKLGGYLEAAGFRDVRVSARYECYSSLPLIGEFLAHQLEENGLHAHGQTLREWSAQPGGMFAQAWVAAIGRR